MNQKEYCKIIFIALVNLLSFLFSLIFLISAYNIQSKKESEGIRLICFNESVPGLIDNNKKSNLALFIFEVFWFAGFFAISMFYYYKNGGDETRIIRYQTVDSPRESERNTENKKENSQLLSYMNKAMIVLFVLCQIFYAIQIILATVLYYKINLIPDNICKKLCKSTILKNIMDIIIVGYIFFILLFLPIYIILLVLFFQQKDCSSTTFCNCFTYNISNLCIFLSNCSKKCHTNEILKEKNSERGKQINDLIKYKDDLKKMNENWNRGIVPSDDELKILNLYKF